MQRCFAPLTKRPRQLLWEGAAEPAGFKALLRVEPVVHGRRMRLPKTIDRQSGNTDSRQLPAGDLRLVASSRDWQQRSTVDANWRPDFKKASRRSISICHSSRWSHPPNHVASPTSDMGNNSTVVAGLCIRAPTAVKPTVTALWTPRPAQSLGSDADIRRSQRLRCK